MDKGNKCATKFCRNKRRPNHPVCHKCATRQYAARHPLKYAFNNLRKRARQRGHTFLLTFEEFQALAESGGWAERHGKTRDSLSIDRIDPDRGYSSDNVQLMTLSENSAKGRRFCFTPYFQSLIDDINKPF